MNTPNLTQIQSQRRNATRELGAKEAANTFARSLSQRRGQRNQADFTEQFRRQTPTFTAGWAGRGMGDSGFYREALGQFVGDFTRDQGRMLEDQQSELAQLDMERAEYRSAFDDYMADLEAQKAARIASTAQYLEAMRPHLGGL